jgi:2-methylcitrate dehydratase PrpD
MSRAWSAVAERTSDGAVGTAAPVTEGIVELVGADDLEARAAARYGRAAIALVDTLAVALAGSRSQGATASRRALLGEDGGRAAVWGTDRRAPLLDAVLCNGVAAHSLDYDDTLHGLTTHPSCHLVPGLLGLAEVVHPSGAAFLTSYLVGLEVEARLAQAMLPGHYKGGWHSTGTIGTVATAAAASRLLGLRGDEVANALGIACSSASGLRANFGSMTKGLHAGHAARGGVEAALLAKEGFDAAHDPFEHQYGFFAATNVASLPPDAAGWNPAALRELAAVERLAFKLFPCCGEAAGGVEAAIVLAGIVNIGEVQRLSIRLSPFAREILEFDVPATPDEARFSGPYCVVVALAQGSLSVRDFEPQAVTRDWLAPLLARSEIIVDATLPTARSATVTVVTATGAESIEVTVPRGDPSVGYTRTEAAEKFLACTAGILGSTESDAVLATLFDIEHVDNVAGVVPMLAVAGADDGRVAK